MLPAEVIFQTLGFGYVMISVVAVVVASHLVGGKKNEKIAEVQEAQDSHSSPIVSVPVVTEWASLSLRASEVLEMKFDEVASNSDSDMVVLQQYAL